jgi:hypothetical protein
VLSTKLEKVPFRRQKGKKRIIIKNEFEEDIKSHSTVVAEHEIKNFPSLSVLRMKKLVAQHGNLIYFINQLEYCAACCSQLLL